MDEIHRPGYHFTPPAHWLNDPNGLVYFDGEYHLFYQYNPKDIVWGPMHWGHAISHDLVSWEHLPIALYPDETGMIFSGSAVVDRENSAGFGRDAMVAIFTYHKELKENQNLAYSTDRGRTWTKYAGNPVIPAPDPIHGFRDPKVFWHQDHWVLCLAAEDTVIFYTSPNLREWMVSGSFGGGYGSTGGVWETPDLFELPVSGGSGTRWVLTVGIGNGGPAGGSATQYFVGQFDGQTFTSENPREMILWADYGADFYAPQAWNDEPQGRRILLGWISSNWNYANLVPASTWRGGYSLPRELSLVQTENGPRLAQKTIAAFESLRGEHRHWSQQTVQPGENILQDIKGEMLEIMADIEVNPEVSQFGFRVHNGEAEGTLIGYDLHQQKMFVDRRHSGQVDFHPSFPAVHYAPLTLVEGVLRLHIFVDTLSVEVFANDGLVCFTESIFPSAGSQGLELFVRGGNLKFRNLELYLLKPASFS